MPVNAYEDVVEPIRSLVALGLEESTFGQVFTPILLSKLPTFVKIEFHRKNGSQQSSLSNPREWLKDEIRARDQGQRAFGESSSASSSDNSGKRSDTTNGKPVFKKSQSSASALVSTSASDKKKKCAYCGEAHFSDRCTKYADVTSRRTKLQNSCSSCLQTGHRVKECQNKVPCFHCKKTNHHCSLCYTKFGFPTDAEPAAEEGGESGLNVDATPFQMRMNRTIMQTAVATLVNNVSVREAPARLLFDTAGSRSFITEQKRNELHLPIVGQESVSIAGFQSKKRRTSTFKIIEFSVRCVDGSSQLVTASVVPSITCRIQKLPLDPALLPSLKKVRLSELLVSEPSFVGIDVLIGLDFYYDFVGSNRIQCQNGPLLFESRLGYIATGRVSTSSPGPETIAVMILNGTPLLDRLSENYSIERYWSLEDIGMKESPKHNDGDEEALQFHSSTLKRDSDGRYSAKWPWKRSDTDLLDNFQVAYGRLKSLLRRLNLNPKLLESYNQIMADQLAKGIIEPVPDNATTNPVYYMPHHCVETPTKTTTKVQVVYDASSKARKDVPSLNDCLHRGPILMEDLCGLLMRFRLNKIALVSDIEKALLQVGLQEADRDVTRFIWVRDVTAPPVGSNLLVLRFCRVPFGIIASSFSLENTVHQHLANIETPVATKMLKDYYVDNIATGENDEPNAIAH